MQFNYQPTHNCFELFHETYRNKFKKKEQTQNTQVLNDEDILVRNLINAYETENCMYVNLKFLFVHGTEIIANCVNQI